MDIQKIIASVYFPYGHHGWEIPYDSNKSIEQYLKEAVDEVNQSNNTINAIVASLKITEHEENGSFKRNKKGERIEKFIYKNEGLFNRLFHI